MKKLAALVALLFLVPAAADDTSHALAIEQLLEVTRAEGMLDTMHSQVDDTFRSAIGKMDIPEKDKPIAEKYLSRMADTLREEMSWPKMKDSFVAIYKGVYSEDEIVEITEFYRSPTGQKFLSKMPQVMQASMKFSQQQMQAFIPKLQQLQQELAAEIRARNESQ